MSIILGKGKGKILTGRFPWKRRGHLNIERLERGMRGWKDTVWPYIGTGEAVAKGDGSCMHSGRGAVEERCDLGMVVNKVAVRRCLSGHRI